MTSHGPHRAFFLPLARAFTLIEMLVVISILTIVILVAVPSFSAMLDSSEESLAENLLTSALKGARDTALKSSGDRDAAAVFTFDPATGKTAILICVKVGALRDVDPAARTDPQAFVLRDVFVPVRDAPAYSLPRGWMIRAFVPAGFIQGNQPDSDQWYAGSFERYDPDEGNWVFPETGFYDPASSTGGLARSSFLVRFEAGTGIMRAGDWNPVLVFDPSKDDSWREPVVAAAVRNNSFASSFDLSQTPDTQVYVERVLNASPGVMRLEGKQRLIGRESPDVILARPVTQLTLYDEYRLANAIDARPDRNSASLYRAPEYLFGDSYGGEAIREPRYVEDVDQALVNRWIHGDTNGDQLIAGAGFVSPDTPEAKILTIDRFSGALHQVQTIPESRGNR